MKSQKQFFLISFLPAIAYWYLESNYNIKVALTGGLILAVIEICLEFFFTKTVHAISKFNFYLILILGGIALFANEGIWFKLQPFFTGLFMGCFLCYKKIRDESLLYETMKHINQKPLPEFIVKKMEFHLGLFLLLYGFFMGWVALQLSTDWWTFFKTIGFYLLSGVFFIGEIFYMRKLVRGRII